MQLASSELARASRFAAKFHYAIWFEPVCDQLQTSLEADSVMEFVFEPVCDQLRTSFEAASIMEFGFKARTAAAGNALESSVIGRVDGTRSFGRTDGTKATS